MKAKIWKGTKNGLKAVGIILLVLMMMVSYEILGNAYKNYNLGVPMGTAIKLAVNNWERRSEKINRFVEEFLETTFAEEDEIIEYPFVNKYIEWNILNKK